MKYKLNLLVLILIIFGCNNDPNNTTTVAVDTIPVPTSTNEEGVRRMAPPLGLGVDQKSTEGVVMGRLARALAVDAAGVTNYVLENKDTLVTTTVIKTITYPETSTTIKKYVTPTQPPVNKAPTANAGIDKSITLPVNSIQLVGSGADSDGSIASYAWVKVSGGAAGLSSPNAASTNVTGLVQGEYIFSLTVKDNGGLSATDDVRVTVNPAIVVPPTGYLSLPKSAKIVAKTGQIIEGVMFENISGVAIEVKNVSNVTIRNCFINKTSEEAIVLENATNVTVENCLFNGVTTGVYALSSGTIKVRNNQFVNVRQRSGGGRGQFVQFNGCYGAGNIIENNKGENFAGESDPEDLISMFKSSGTASSPILIRNNMFRGGGPSASGGGIMLGDYGGSYQIAENNKLLDPGQYGMAFAGGNNCQIINNLIVAKQQPFTNNPLYMWAQQGAACSNNTVSGNKVYWIDKNGGFNGGWDAGNCSGSSFTYPARFSSYAEGVSALGLPTHLIDFITPQQLLQIRGK